MITIYCIYMVVSSSGGLDVVYGVDPSSASGSQTSGSLPYTDPSAAVMMVQVAPVKANNESIPKALNWKDKDLYPNAVNQKTCNLCGWISGTQALLSRVAIATENYQQWSIQNVITCSQTKICKGTHPYRVNTILSKNMNYIVPEMENPFVGKACAKNNTCKCVHAGSSHRPALMDTQWFFIGPNVRAPNVSEAEKALQFGPITTCFTRNKTKPIGDQCSSGCKHANAIIGYDKDRWYLQESYGPNYQYPKNNPIVNNGTWFAYRNTSCEQALLEKTYYPKIFFDYDRANAYFTPEAVQESQLNYISKNSQAVSPADFSNVGMAKRRCSLMGSKCKGVAKTKNGDIELIESVGPSQAASTNGNKTTIFKKTQMVIYLRHSSGKYLGVKLSKGRYLLTAAANITMAASFFTSNARIISFQYPNYLLANWGRLLSHNVSNLDFKNFWKLEQANLKNQVSGLSMDIDSSGKIKGSPFNKTSPSQSFTLYLSGKWSVYSKYRGQFLRKIKDNDFVFADSSQVPKMAYLRWQARQVTTSKGKPFNSSWVLSGGYVDIGEKENQVTPTDTLLALYVGSKRYLGISNGSVGHFSKPDNTSTRWSFEYADV